MIPPTISVSSSTDSAALSEYELLDLFSSCAALTYINQFCQTTYPQCTSSGNFLMNWCPSYCSTLVGCSAASINFASSTSCQMNVQQGGMYGFAATNSNCYTGVVASAFSLLPKVSLLALVGLVGLVGAYLM